MSECRICCLPLTCSGDRTTAFSSGRRCTLELSIQASHAPPDLFRSPRRPQSGRTFGTRPTSVLTMPGCQDLGLLPRNDGQVLGSGAVNPRLRACCRTTRRSAVNPIESIATRREPASETTKHRADSPGSASVYMIAAMVQQPNLRRPRPAPAQHDSSTLPAGPRAARNSAGQRRPSLRLRPCRP